MKFFKHINLLLLLILFVSCNEDPGVLSTKSNNGEEFETYPPGADSIFIPLNLPPSEIPNLRVSKVIDGNDGGKIEFDYEYQTKDGNTITISAELEFEDGAFDGIEEIWMIFNNETATISFYPHLVFNEEVELEVEYTGIDLSGFNPNTVDFIFQNYDGTIENVEYDEIEIDVSNGTIELDDAELTHFSRYGFVN